jgi:protein tyrosine phosphatase (PTP) superfamily phosphohydrolase (DUF442 family)
MAAFLLILGREPWRVLLGLNAHEVVARMVYRAAQPSAEEMQDLVARYGIRTVVNLRGSCDPSDWFVAEAKTTARLQIAQEDICFSSGRLPSDQELRQLVEAFDRAEYPLLVHCRRGADRTGLASVLYLLLETDAGLVQARRQLGLRFGHVSMSQTAAMDQFFDLYEDWLRSVHLAHTSERFRHWVLHGYRGGGYGYHLDSIVWRKNDIKVAQPFGVQVRVRNTGWKPWRFQPIGSGGFKAGFSLRDDQELEVATGYAGLFDAMVQPGETIDLTLPVPGVVRPGHYRLMIDMLDPEFVWFFQMGSEPFEEEFVIRE